MIGQAISPAFVGILSIGAALACAGTVAPESAQDVEPRILVLGTAQDGGFPHAGCTRARCAKARAEPGRGRLVASLALIAPARREVHLIDATPDIRPQLDQIEGLRDPRRRATDRSPVDSVLLTHAHLGHYTGLGFFGYEAMHTRRLAVFCTTAMADFLKSNGPWSQLVDLGNVALRPLQYGQTVSLTGQLRVTPLAVPHRDEFTDTVGFVIRGPRRVVLYVPDTDSWTAWRPSLLEVLARNEIDVAILDGTFFSPDELPGRDASSIGHPTVRESLDLLEPRVHAGDLAVFFTHLNHSNPVLDADGPARAEVEARGFAILADGQEIPL